MKRFLHTKSYHFQIPEKASWILNLILFALLLIVFRLWHLSVVQHDSKLEESRKPQRRTITQPAKRATIRDRFGIPLAINKVRYQAAILYSQIREVPTTQWKTDELGNRIKIPKRKEYIKSLSALLGNELHLDPERIEDLIHSKAAMYYSIPYVIKEDLTEKEYYRLKMLEKDWLGLHVQCLPQRTYPQRKVASDIIGYMGAINRQQYEAVVSEMKAIEGFLDDYENGKDPQLPPDIENVTMARTRLKDLKEKAYTINDYVGKTGVESYYDEDLRGFQGKKSYYSDAKGTFLREFPDSRDPIPGKRLYLTISSELQAFAESLLIQNECVRKAYISQSDTPGGILSKQPWIKGGAIVVLDPNNGEILALASHPRFDPNDFILNGSADVCTQKKNNILRWLEHEDYIANIWNMKCPLSREYFDEEGKEQEEHVWMTLENYLKFILPEKHVIIEALASVKNIKNAILVQEAIQDLLFISDQKNMYWVLETLYASNNLEKASGTPPLIKQAISERFENNSKSVKKSKSILDKYIGNMQSTHDRVFFIDLCHLIVPKERFISQLIDKIGNQSLNDYREASAAFATIDAAAKQLCMELFNKTFFKEWRIKNEKAFLKEKRAEETLLKKYPKPYIDYLDQKEKELFNTFWGEHKWSLIGTFLDGLAALPELSDYEKLLINWHEELSSGAHKDLSWFKAYQTLKDKTTMLNKKDQINYLSTLRSFKELTQPLYGTYPRLRKEDGKSLEKHLAAAFYPHYGFGTGRSHAFRQSSTQGSLFKLVTGYTALMQEYAQKGFVHSNILEINDISEKQGKDVLIAYKSDGTPVMQHYKGGRLIRSNSRNIGKTDFLKALEVSSNPYFSLLAGDFLTDPEDLSKAAKAFSYGSKTGIDLPGEIAGKIPNDLSTNRTGLYSTAIGQHSLVVTPLQAALMLSAISNGGSIFKPSIVKTIEGISSLDHQEPIAHPIKFKHQDTLNLLGLDFPLFVNVDRKEGTNKVERLQGLPSRQIPMPSPVRNLLLEGMNRSVARIHQSGFAGLSQLFRDYPEAISDLLEMKHHLIGKTSTSESIEQIDLDQDNGMNKYTHIWFGGISFDNPTQEPLTFLSRNAIGKPELVVIVYLKYGRYGKEAVPLAAQIIQKWKEIQQKH